VTGADPYRFPPFYENRSDTSELLKNPQKETLGIKNSRTFLKGALPLTPVEDTRYFGNQSPFILDPRLHEIEEISRTYLKLANFRAKFRVFRARVGKNAKIIATKRERQTD